MSQRGADVSYILIQLLLQYLKNLLIYTAWHHYFQVFFAIQIPPSHIFIMRVYTMPLYCTCSVSQRCKQTRATSLRRPFSSRNIRPKFKMTCVSERGRRKLYFDPTFVTVSQKTCWVIQLDILFAGFFLPFKSLPATACVHNAFVLYLLSVTALQKDEGYFPSAAVL